MLYKCSNCKNELLEKDFYNSPYTSNSNVIDVNGTFHYKCSICFQQGYFPHILYKRAINISKNYDNILEIELLCPYTNYYKMKLIDKELSKVYKVVTFI